MITWEDPTPVDDKLHCALCGATLYPEELHADELEPRPTVWKHLCGACERRWWIASAEQVMTHFADRLRQRGHRVILVLDGKLL